MRLSLLFAIALPACATGTPAMDRDAALDKTFAGQNRCQETADNKPFIIEWDATDMATFESRAQNDIVFVRYEGCDLEVIDACVDDSVPGRFGAYKPPQWTSGSVEKILIEDQSDLFAKLPLGVATFGGDVARGVKLEMEYFVSGVATATRSAIHRGALRNNSACAKATHYVYAFNLGAFAIDSLETASEELTADVSDIGGGVRSDRKTQSAKRAGDLSACGGQTAAETDRCRVPIRLALRPIETGEGSGGDDAPPPPAAGEAESNLAMAAKLRKEAQRKAMAGDGQACLDDLKRADAMDPDPQRSSNSGLGQLHLRAQCEMMTGDCESGKVHLRKAHQEASPHVPTGEVDKMVSQTAKGYCKAERDEWDEVDWLTRKIKVPWLGKDWKTCASHGPALREALSKVKEPSGAEWERSSTWKGGTSAMLDVGECLARLGQCAEGKAFLREGLTLRRQGPKEPEFTEAWEKRFPECKGE